MLLFLSEEKALYGKVPCELKKKKKNHTYKMHNHQSHAQSPPHPARGDSRSVALATRKTHGDRGRGRDRATT